jgi:hypothetical protein
MSRPPRANAVICAVLHPRVLIPCSEIPPIALSPTSLDTVAIFGLMVSCLRSPPPVHRTMIVNYASLPPIYLVFRTPLCGTHIRIQQGIAGETQEPGVDRLWATKWSRSRMHHLRFWQKTGAHSLRLSSIAEMSRKNVPYQLFQERHDDDSYNGDFSVTQANGASHERSSNSRPMSISLTSRSIENNSCSTYRVWTKLVTERSK